MARIPRGGAVFSTLYEEDARLEDVVASAGLKPLSVRSEKMVRTILGEAIGRWYQDEGEYAPEARLTIEDVSSRLNGLATALDSITETLRAASFGFQHVHDTEVFGQLTMALAQDPVIGSAEKAQTMIAGFLNQASTVSQAAKNATAQLNKVRTQQGRRRLRWHDRFTEAVILLCKLNGKKTTIVTDRITNQPTGDFLEVATVLQQLLPPPMRTRDARAIAQRLHRSMRLLKSRSDKSLPGEQA